MSGTTRSRRPRRRGIFLIHMLMTIGVLAEFVIVAERVFRLSVLTVSKSAAGQEQALRLERSLEVLRAEVWRAAKVEPAGNGSSVRVTDAAGKAVEWRTDEPSGDLVRIDGGEERRWPELGLTFRSAEGGVLSVATSAGEVAVLRRAAGGAR